MPYMVDTETGKFWKDFGGGLVDTFEEAEVYSLGQAMALARIHWETSHYITNGEENPKLPPVWVEHRYTPQPRTAPFRTQQMKDKNLIWVRLDDVWLAADVQSLTMASMLVLNATTPHTKIQERKPLEPINFDFADDGPSVA